MPPAALQRDDFDLDLDGMLPLRDAAALMRRDRSTVWRWTDAGITTADGQRIRLRTALAGARRRVTTRKWLAEFVRELTAAGGE